MRRSQVDARSAPLGELVALAGEVPPGGDLTIDFAAAAELGQPLVVLRLAPEQRDDPRLASLSAREREVAGLVAAGQTNREIADQLCIALGTVKDHVHHILTKTGLRNRAAVVAAWGVRPDRRV